MVKIRLIDHCFGDYFTAYERSKYVIWDKTDQSADFMIFTDASIKRHEEYTARYKVAWIIEPRAIFKDIYEYVKNNIDSFEMVFTYDAQLLSLFEKCKPYYGVGSWLWYRDMKLHPKTYNASIIASMKKTTVGHQMRHNVIKQFKDRIECIRGLGYEPIDYKLESLRACRYSIEIENSQQDNYFTDKLLDCLLTGTVPVYWGCKNVGSLFDIRGMHIFNSIDELESIFQQLGEDDYKSKYKYVVNNLQEALKYSSVDDYIYTNYLIKYIEQGVINAD